ncbi:MAG: hypothetical protein ACI4DP_09925 [Candidatus Ornithomonoglobus sp.]
MPYIVKSTEKLRKSCAETETKALLYLMNYRNDSKDIFYFVIDFFNDLSGMDRYSEKIWDVQSKANSNTNPKSVGKELVTLFKNYLSDFEFTEYILFIGGVSESFRIDQSINIFGMENVKDKAKESVKKGLKEEALAKQYIDDSQVTNANVEVFLKRVTFVIDNASKSDYVKGIISQHPKVIPDDNTLEAIFNEIRNKQSEKKNTNIEDRELSTPDEALSFGRHLTSNEIRLLTLQRIINKNPVEKGSCPISFAPIFNSFPPEEQRYKLEECVQSMCRALFNKNEAACFWTLFENIYDLIVNNPKDSVQELFLKLNAEKRNACTDFDVLSLKYFISVVKDGIQNGY